MQQRVYDDDKAILLGSGWMISFGLPMSSSGHGIRDNAGVIECKSVGGSWTPVGSDPADLTQLILQVGTISTTVGLHTLQIGTISGTVGLNTLAIGTVSNSLGLLSLQVGTISGSLSGLLNTFSATHAAPQVVTGTFTGTVNVFGTLTSVLGNPNAWFEIYIGATPYLMPLYALS